MVTLWIGDFRTKQIQQIYEEAQQTAEYHYIVDNLAEYSWFKNNAVSQLPKISLENANIVIMLGFIDCVYSCVWDMFNIDEIAKQYAETINSLIEDYPNFNFYVCSVNPVNANYPFAENLNGIIEKNNLNEQIGKFNNKLKSLCTATYIDSFNYLLSTSFDTRDGVRFTYNICIDLHNFISANFKSTNYATFLPRLTAPDSEIDTYLYWINTYKEGENPFPSKNTTTGFTLPSCEAYAWGRFYEIIGETPTLITSDSRNWFTYNDGYKRGTEPTVGSVACWTGALGGFVAVVEQVREDGSITTSESTDTEVWQLTERSKGTNENWGMDPAVYTFQGFIYCPAMIPTASIGKLDKSTVISENRALSQSEMECNAKYIWNYLGSQGWSLNAVAGMLGNMEAESTINPGREQVGSGTGFGLVQWTPGQDFKDWCTSRGLTPSDIDSQLTKIIYEKDNGIQYYKNNYKYTFETFSTSLDNPYTLACAFAFDYERSWVVLYGSESQKETLRKERGTNAEKWYNFLAPYALSTTVEERFILDNFKIDMLGFTEVTASFIIRNGNNGYYTLIDNSGNELISEPLQISTSDNRLQVIYFTCKKQLIPNTEYTLKVQATGLVGENTIIRSIHFITPQDLPSSPKSINLSCGDTIKSVNSIFKLDVKMPTYLGYWGKNSTGYEKQLIIDGKIVKTNTVFGIKNILQEFFIKDEFDYDCKTGDSIQVGIRIWTLDNKNNKIYDSNVAKTSNTICLLNNPIQTYLNIK